MTKVRIEPGICGFTAIAEAEAAEDFMVHLRVGERLRRRTGDDEGSRQHIQRV